MEKNEKQISFGKLLKLSLAPGAKIHFIGIGGASMSSLAAIALASGVRISGSDTEDNETIGRLRSLGAEIKKGHSSSNVKGASLVVYSHAISEDNPERLEAVAREIPTVSRAEYMGALMIRYKNRIGVSGTHGKSTTVAMLDAIFSHALAEPTVLSGSELPSGQNFKIGSEDLLIYEACEYKDSFLSFSPTIALALNLDLDHTDYFHDIRALRRSFTKALGKATKFALINSDSENLVPVIRRMGQKTLTFGQNERADYRYRITSFHDCGFEFVIERRATRIAELKINIPGVFNVTNAAAAAIIAIEYGIDIEIIKEALSDFSGIKRRLEYIGDRGGRPVYYDYAHHPAEIRASLNALKILTGEDITVIFKPHTYTRTKSLWEDFCRSLSMAERVILTDIYPAREKEIPGISSSRLAYDIGSKAVCIPDSEVCAEVDKISNGAIVIMGAGDMSEIKRELLE